MSKIEDATSSFSMHRRGFHAIALAFDSQCEHQSQVTAISVQFLIKTVNGSIPNQNSSIPNQNSQQEVSSVITKST